MRQQDGAELNRRLVGSASVALVLIFLIQALVVAFPLHLLGQWWVQAAIVTGGVSLYFLTQWLFRGRPEI